MELVLNIDRYRELLLAEEQRILDRIKRAETNARETVDSVHDWGDESVIDEQEDEELAEASTESAVLKQVRDALQRIDDGTFGKCLVDGEPIEEERLQAEPWTPYCLKHQQLLESSRQARTPSL
jgi:DnaK suppressor protein